MLDFDTWNDKKAQNENLVCSVKGWFFIKFEFWQNQPFLPGWLEDTYNALSVGFSGSEGSRLSISEKKPALPEVFMQMSYYESKQDGG